MTQGKRRIDRITSADFITGLDALSLDEVRARRDECRDEVDHLSMIRRYLQVRAEVLKSEMERRAGGGPSSDSSLVEQLTDILSQDGKFPRTSRGAAVRVPPPGEEILLARRRVEKLVAEQGVIDPTELSDDELREAAENLAEEERSVSADRSTAMGVLDALQEELKQRFKEDPSAAIAR